MMQDGTCLPGLTHLQASGLETSGLMTADYSALQDSRRLVNQTIESIEPAAPPRYSSYASTAVAPATNSAPNNSTGTQNAPAPLPPKIEASAGEVFTTLTPAVPFAIKTSKHDETEQGDFLHSTAAARFEDGTENMAGTIQPLPPALTFYARDIHASAIAGDIADALLSPPPKKAVKARIEQKLENEAVPARVKERERARDVGDIHASAIFDDIAGACMVPSVDHVACVDNQMRVESTFSETPRRQQQTPAELTPQSQATQYIDGVAVRNIYWPIFQSPIVVTPPVPPTAHDESSIYLPPPSTPPPHVIDETQVEAKAEPHPSQAEARAHPHRSQSQATSESRCTHFEDHRCPGVMHGSLHGWVP